MTLHIDLHRITRITLSDPRIVEGELGPFATRTLYVTSLDYEGKEVEQKIELYADSVDDLLLGSERATAEHEAPV